MSKTNSILYLEKLRRLLMMEYEAEKQEYLTPLMESPQGALQNVMRMVRRGTCWYGLSVGRSYYNSLNQLVVEVYREKSEEDDEETLFEYNKAVMFFTLTGEKGHERLVILKSFGNSGGRVSFVDGNRMVVSIPSAECVLEMKNSESRVLGVMLYFDETSYKAMLHAIEAPLQMTRKDNNGEKIKLASSNRLVELREVFAGNQKARKFTMSPMRAPWLNPSQEKAVNEVLWAKDVAVVHGPPGTGKTTTLVEAIYETLRRETQVLVCAQSNTAVDWISEKLVDHGISVLRIGNPSRVNDKMLSFTYERRFESHPDYPELWSIRNTIRKVRSEKRTNGDRHQKLYRLRERAAEIEMRINQELFAEARVVSCTLVGAANKIMVGQHFSTLFIDEAAQALEPACWIAIRRAGRVVLAGDHQQLPPTVKCFEAMQQGLGRTLMERIVESQPDSVMLLTTQYRMNDAIMQFSSKWFYDGMLKSHPSVQYRSVLDYEDPIVWVDSEEPEQYVGKNHGRINKAEAELLLLNLEGYINKIGKQRFLEERIDVGIISPYRVQTQYIRQRIMSNEFFKPFRSLITVSTVDGFQGQERDIILISLVRSNEHGQIGFLSDLRRMNVAMTRARMKLIIFGNKQTLSHSEFYEKLIEHIAEHTS